MYLKIGLTVFLLRFVHSFCDYSNGFGEQYKWSADIDSAMQEGRETGKPVVVIIHKSWCCRCDSLKAEFGKCKQLQKISSHFVLVNCIDEDEPTDPSYTPDGCYVPRIIFKWGNGESINCTNKWGLKKYKHYFYEAKHVVNCLEEIDASILKSKMQRQ